MNSSSKKNIAIRNALSEAKMTQWELALLLGVSEPTITRWLRQELPEEKQREIVEIIKKGG